MKEFGTWRSFFWPIHRFELKKVLPMFMLFFLISFTYNILRNTKETLIVTAAGSGAEAILFIKSGLTLPTSILMTIGYAKLSNILSKKALFYTVITPFLVFFVLFALFLYPNRELLHPSEAADALQALLPEGFMGLIAVFRNWTYALFYEFAELWGSFMLAMMFWGFSNEITKVEEAKRFYPMFGVGANLALICAGWATVYVSDIRQGLPPEVDAWGISLNYMTWMLAVACLGIMATYWWINRYVLPDPQFYSPKEQLQKQSEKPTLSLKESFFYLVKSPYIGCMAMLVIGYGISINIIEVTWKSQLKMQYPNSNDYNTFMGYFSTCTGFGALIMLFVGGSLIRRFGWGFAALVTPVVLLTSGIVFFALVIFGDRFNPLMGLFGMTPLMLAVMVGAFQNMMSKSCKYSIFDPTKEMAYIPLDQEQKVKGKASIDVVGARFGKATGSFIQQLLVIGFGSISAVTPYLSLILIAIIALWILAVKSLNRRFSLLAVQQS